MGIFEVFIGGDKLHIHLWSRPLPHFEEKFSRYRILDWQCFSFFLKKKKKKTKNTLNTYISLLPYGLQCFWWEICWASYWGCFICDKSLLFCFFQVSFFVIIFQQFDYKCILGWISLSSSCLEVVELLDAYIHVFHKTWCISAIISSGNIFPLFIFSL